MNEPRIGDLMGIQDIAKFKDIGQRPLPRILSKEETELMSTYVAWYDRRHNELTDHCAEFIGDNSFDTQPTKNVLPLLMQHINIAMPSAELSELITIIAPSTLDGHDEHDAELMRLLPAWVESKYNHNPKDYEITDGLAEQLLHTEIRGVRQAEIKLPFDALKIHLPLSVFPKAGFVILHCHSYVMVDYRNVFMFTPNLAMTVYRRDGSLRTIISLRLDPDIDIHETKSQIKRGDDLDRIPEWILNVVLYMTSSEVRSETKATNLEYVALTDRLNKAKGTKREKIKERRRSLDPSYRIILGVGVPRLSMQGTGTNLLVRTLVAGHWRNQVCGPKNTLRKHIWIQPFWRGPDLAPATAPIRVMQ